MEQPGSPTPSEDQEAQAAPNTDPQSANEGSGGPSSEDTLNEMYLTLGHLVAAHDLHRKDSESRLKALSKATEDLQRQREEALTEGDHMKYANAIRGLSEIRKVAAILEHDAEDELRATHQSEDGDSPSDERGGAGDDPGSGTGSPLAGDGDGVGVGGDGDPDDQVGDDDDLAGGGLSGGSGDDPGASVRGQ